MNAVGSIRGEALPGGATSLSGRTSDAARGVLRLARAHPFLFYITFVMTGAALYYWVLAAPLYTSEAKFAIRGKQPVQSSPLLAALSGAPQAGVPESTALADYIESPDLLARIDAPLGLRRLYARLRTDVFYHMSATAPERRFLAFYRRMVKVDVDSASNILTLKVTSFDPNSAQATNASIVSHSAEFVAGLSRQMLDESTRAAQNEFDLAQSEAIKARLAVNGFQSRAGNLDPNASGAAGSSAIFSLEAEVARLRAQLASLRTYSTGRSPQVIQVQAQIANLQGQIAQNRRRLVGQGGGTISSQLNSYQGLAIRQNYADQRLVAAQAALDQAKSLAVQRQLFIVTIAQPSRPDESDPRALWGMLTVLAIALCFYVIGTFTLASIRDHRI
jgi:capsular polysaccharide transport system permease protein